MQLLLPQLKAVPAQEKRKREREKKERKQITLSLAHTFAQSIRKFMAREKKAIIILARLHSVDLF